MPWSVLFVGETVWLESAMVRALRSSARVVCVGACTPDASGANQLCASARVILFHLGNEMETGLRRLEFVVCVRGAGRVIATGDASDDVLLERCVDHGAWGFLSAESDMRGYLDVIRGVCAGRLCYPRSILDRIETTGGRMRMAAPSGAVTKNLSADERALLALLAGGATTTEAANELGIDARQARGRRSRLMRKLRLPNIASLVRLAIREGLISP